jgi:hypothetical protein
VTFTSGQITVRVFSLWIPFAFRDEEKMNDNQILLIPTSFFYFDLFLDFFFNEPFCMILNFSHRPFTEIEVTVSPTPCWLMRDLRQSARVVTMWKITKWTTPYNPRGKVVPNTLFMPAVAVETKVSE